MKMPKLKVCGLNNPKNIQEIAAIQPDFIGYIFWEHSKRFYNLTAVENLSNSIQKVGVFVDASESEILDKIKQFDLNYVQLHGKESPSFCKKIQLLNVKVIKAFAIDSEFNFNVLDYFNDTTDFFLFDTRGENPGGNGTTFDWEILKQYKLQKPFFLSGGIGLKEIKKIHEFLKTDTGKLCYAIDINSKFETEPGLKDTAKINEFKTKLYENNI